MTRLRLLPLALLLALALPLTAAAQRPAVDPSPAEGIDWHGSVEEALTAAETSGKKVIVDVFAPWCGWCARLQKEVYGDESVQAFVADNFEMVRLNGEVSDDIVQFQQYTLSSQMLAQALGATGYPTTVFLAEDGSYVTKLPGFSAPPDFLNVLGFIASEAYLTQKFEEYLEAGASGR
jgi:thioredoxin-related protein